uniref:Alkyl hydroperoxide reductase subunit C/ Thiol specific antioxidant domain-containing protein n=1 Tax=Alexandrium monilatum TaxID=311494 RepID=A0A7S4QUM9_9DINO
MHRMQVCGQFHTEPDGKIRDVDGHWLDLSALCREHLVIVCTFKCVPCPVCPEQMRRIRREPLRSFFREAGVRFLVLCPGPTPLLKASRDALKPYLIGEDVPFICDETMAIAGGINAILGPGQIIPCFFELKPDLSVGWTQLGRGPGNFGDGKVARFVEEALLTAQAEAEGKFQALSGRLERLLPTLLEPQPGRPPQAQGRTMPPGMLESHLQLLAPRERLQAAVTCREWLLSQALLARREAERCLGAMRHARDVQAEEEMRLLQQGCARPQQRIEVTLHQPRLGCGPGRVLGVLDGGHVEVETADGHGTVPPHCLSAPPWAGQAVPALKGFATAMAMHSRMLSLPPQPQQEKNEPTPGASSTAAAATQRSVAAAAPQPAQGRFRFAAAAVGAAVLAAVVKWGHGRAE